MIYVRRDANQIPPELFARAIRAQETLDGLPEAERTEFIKNNAKIWRDFKECLSRMSYGKCWYSESPEVQSFLDVDHYRPKLEAIREEGVKERGYEWLAFSWENFRLSAQRSNRRSTNEETDETEGKGSWFPLLPNSQKACWEDRCEQDEQPVLLDPTCRDDVDLVDIADDGRICESNVCVGTSRQRVRRSIELYGLDLPKLVSARKQVMREIIKLHEAFLEVLVVANRHEEAADDLPIDTLKEQIRQKTLPNSPYSKAARAQLLKLVGGSSLCAVPEDLP